MRGHHSTYLRYCSHNRSYKAKLLVTEHLDLKFTLVITVESFPWAPYLLCVPIVCSQFVKSDEGREEMKLMGEYAKEMLYNINYNIFMRFHQPWLYITA